MDNLASLPPWAKRRIEELETALAAERWSNAAIAASGSDTWVEPLLPAISKRTHLPNGSVVKFHGKGGIVSVCVPRDGGEVEIKIFATPEL